MRIKKGVNPRIIFFLGDLNSITLLSTLLSTLLYYRADPLVINTNRNTLLIRIFYQKTV